MDETSVTEPVPSDGITETQNAVTYAVTGTKFRDLTGDGLSDDDIAWNASLLGAITMFIDVDGDGTAVEGFSAPVGDDGSWAIEGLTAGQAALAQGKSILEILPDGTVLDTGETVDFTGTGGTEWFLLDGFGDDQDLSLREEGSVESTVALTDTSLTGAERTAILTTTDTDPPPANDVPPVAMLMIGNTPATGELSLSNGNDTLSDVELLYGGAGGTGLGGIDITLSGAVPGLEIEGTSDFVDGPLDLELEIADTTGASVTVAISVTDPVPGNGNADEPFTAFFDHAGFAGVDLTLVESIAFRILDEDETDLAIDFIGYEFDLPGIDSGNDVANFAPFMIEGTKTLDLDGDGVVDAGEPGLGGVTIYVDLDGDDAFDEGAEPSAVTAEDGSWSIEGLGPDALGKAVREVVPEGYEQTGPIEWLLAAVAEDRTGLDFLNAPLGDGDFAGNTPGFWKNHPCVLDRELRENTAWTADSLFAEVFGVDPTEGRRIDADLTLAEAVTLGGGPGGYAQLAKHATAALLNTATDGTVYGKGDLELTGMLADTFELVDDGDGVLEVEEIVAAVGEVWSDDAWTGADDIGREEVKDLFDALNNGLDEIQEVVPDFKDCELV